MRGSRAGAIGERVAAMTAETLIARKAELEQGALDGFAQVAPEGAVFQFLDSPIGYGGELLRVIFAVTYRGYGCAREMTLRATANDAVAAGGFAARVVKRAADRGGAPEGCDCANGTEPSLWPHCPVHGVEAPIFDVMGPTLDLAALANRSASNTDQPFSLPDFVEWLRRGGPFAHEGQARSVGARAAGDQPASRRSDESPC